MIALITRRPALVRALSLLKRVEATLSILLSINRVISDGLSITDWTDEDG